MEVRLLTAKDLPLLLATGPEVFDHPVDARWAAEFLADPRHHLVAAVDDGVVVGMASAVHYVHPDKPTELWINEVGVAGTHQGRGIGKAMVRELLRHAQALGATQAWVLTERTNAPAMGLYAAAGGLEAPDDVVMFEFDLGHAPPRPVPPRRGSP